MATQSSTAQTLFFERDQLTKIAYQLLRPDHPSTVTPVVLIQGLTGVKEDWRNFSPDLAHDRTVLVFDNRGVGETTYDCNIPFTVDMFANDTIALVRHVFPHHKRVHVLGISMGGIIAQTIAILCPEIVLSLVLGCTTPCTTPSGKVPPARGADVIASLMKPGLTNAELYEFFTKLLANNFTPQWIEANPEKFQSIAQTAILYQRPIPGIIAQMTALTNFDSTASIGEFRSFRTLVVHGDSDAVLPYENGVIISKLIPRATLLTLPGVGHVFWDMDNGLSAQRIRQFFNESHD
jgi:pimeloyl-ACP methyl ester carboxylesterase